jgi:hypothetical protein
VGPGWCEEAPYQCRRLERRFVSKRDFGGHAVDGQQTRSEAGCGKYLVESIPLGFIEGEANLGDGPGGMVELGIDREWGRSESFEKVFEKSGRNTNFSGEEFAGLGGVKQSSCHENTPLAIFFRGCN